MSWARRPERDTPRMEQRRFRDERGRTWVGSVGSGSQRGGESRAEINFVCIDQPDELKRVAWLDVAASRADDVWRALDETVVRDVFRRSEPA